MDRDPQAAMARWRALVPFAFALLPMAACQRNGATTDPKKPDIKVELPPYFQDVTAQTGIDFRYRNGEEAGHYAILESLGGGVALFDFDGDGLLDVFVIGGGYFDGPDKKTIRGYPNKLYKNLGGWKFRDVTKEAGLETPLFYGHGVAVADYDRDGWPDLLVTGYGRVCLYHNESDGTGGRRFVDVTQAAGLAGLPIWATSAAWGDLDGDGFPDLYICNYVNWSFTNHPHCRGYTADVKRDICSPRQFEAQPHRLYHNDGKGRFTDVSKPAGLRHTREDKDYGKGLGVIIVDINDDRLPDIYVANDTTDNLLYLNKSKPGALRFEEASLELGVARDHNGVSNGSMGVDAADFDGSGKKNEAQELAVRLDRIRADEKEMAVLMTDMQRAPEDPALRQQIGEIFLRNGLAEDGLRWLGSALQYDAGYTAAREVLAEWWESRGDNEKAAPHREVLARQGVAKKANRFVEQK
jgi:enediyne biosynthesis protein E4